MTLRFLADATKIPLTHSPYGYMTLNGTFHGIPMTFALDTTLHGVATNCNDLTIGNWKTHANWTDTCPDKCSSNVTIPLLSSETGAIQVDPFAADLSFADLSFPAFKAARICGSEVYNTAKTILAANSVVGLGPATPKAYANATQKLDAIPWSKYSIFMSNTSADGGSFLLPGGVDADLIAKESLVETKLPATTETGWTVNIDAFSTSANASINAPCSSTNPCSATVAASSPVLQLGKDIWNTIVPSLAQPPCFKRGQFGFDNLVLYECDDWVKLPTLLFTMGERTFTLQPSDYTFSSSLGKNPTVVILIAPENRDYSYTAKWILGAPFLRTYYSAFDADAKTVSFYCKDGVNCVDKEKATARPPSTSSASPVGWKWTCVLALAASALLMV